jgi:N-methylhydantoinase B/oxoprolinase/acetone carboxylase alpha subunit
MHAPDDFWESESLHYPRRTVRDALDDARGKVNSLMAEYGEEQWTEGWNAALYYAAEAVEALRQQYAMETGHVALAVATITNLMRETP